MGAATGAVLTVTAVAALAAPALANPDAPAVTSPTDQAPPAPERRQPTFGLCLPISRVDPGFYPIPPDAFGTPDPGFAPTEGIANDIDPGFFVRLPPCAGPEPPPAEPASWLVGHPPRTTGLTPSVEATASATPTAAP